MIDILLACAAITGGLVLSIILYRRPDIMQDCEPDYSREAYKHDLMEMDLDLFIKKWRDRMPKKWCRWKGDQFQVLCNDGAYIDWDAAAQERFFKAANDSPTATENTTPNPRFSVGQWVRHRGTGQLGCLLHNNQDEFIWCVSTAYGSPFFGESQLAPAYPRKGEWWKFNWRPEEKMERDYPEHVEEVKEGCLVPVNYGRGHE